MKRLGTIILCLAGLLGGESVALEEPNYEELQAGDGFEIRRYDGYIVAETTVEGDFTDAGNKAFRILAGYIFGDNRSAEKMKMTAPVESRAADDGVKMEMTAPVTTRGTDSGDDTYTYGFVMEREYTLETLPVPNDSRVTIRRVEPRVMAVRRFSGFWSESNFDKNERKLLEWIAAEGLTPIGEPILARYNGPFTPWFMRRNEVMVDVEWPHDGDLARR